MPYRYELHLHTQASPDSPTSPDEIVRHALWKGLDGIAVTDHNTTDGIAAVRDAAPEELDVITGVEVSTTQGHILGFGVRSTPPKDEPLNVIEHIHDADGYAVLAHPFDPLRPRFTDDLEQIADAADGVEITNARCIRHTYNRRAEQFAARHSLLEIGGSDAHQHWEIGRVVTVTDRPLLNAFNDQEGVMRVDGRGGYILTHFLTNLQAAWNVLT